MAEKVLIVSEETVKNKIFTIRNVQVMLDSDLAQLYNVKIKRLNEQVKRNKERFPINFCFQLTDNEYDSLRSQFATLEKEVLKSQIVTSIEEIIRFQNGTLNTTRGAHRKYLPYVFTEQGVAMLSTVLRSDTAVKISIQIINAFVNMRKFLLKNAELFGRLDYVERKQLEFQVKTDQNFERVFEAIEDKTFQKKQGIFFEGQIFDAYQFVSDLVRTAKRSIVLIDNFVDDSVLVLFSKREAGVKVIIYTKNFTPQLRLDLEKYTKNL